MYSILTAPFSFAPHSLHSLVKVSLAPGTQWSQKPRLRLPAAKAPCTKGAVSAVVAVAAAAVCNTVRRGSGGFPLFFPPPCLEYERQAPLLAPAPRLMAGLPQYYRNRAKSHWLFTPIAFAKVNAGG